MHPAGSARSVTARRMVARDIADRAVVRKLFDTIAPRFVERPGGYTRLLRLGHRRGDSAEVALVELVGSEYNPSLAAGGEKAGDASPDAPKKKTVGGRLREALGGGRRRKSEGDTGTKAKADKAAKGAGKKVTTPRKAGGS